jgi:hypothetical protein
MASPSESARVRIINKYGLTVGVDSTLIIVDVFVARVLLRVMLAIVPTLVREYPSRSREALAPLQ